MRMAPVQSMMAALLLLIGSAAAVAETLSVSMPTRTVNVSTHIERGDPRLNGSEDLGTHTVESSTTPVFDTNLGTLNKATLWVQNYSFLSIRIHQSAPDEYGDPSSGYFVSGGVDNTNVITSTGCPGPIGGSAECYRESTEFYGELVIPYFDSATDGPYVGQTLNWQPSYRLGYTLQTDTTVVDWVDVNVAAFTGAFVLFEYTPPPPDDSDGDGVLDVSDNCPHTPNPDQADNDGDLAGDVCDGDDDNDSVLDGVDNCPFNANADQTDTDGDGLGDVCDSDADGDGIGNNADNCPQVPNPGQEDNDGDASGDACDADDDNDGVDDETDNCQFTSNSDQANQDGDAFGDACDADIDGDGVADDVDNCPLISNPAQDDSDQDGSGDVCDNDADNDGVTNDADNCPFDVNPDQTDQNGNGIGDVCEDADHDGLNDDVDNCPQVANPDQGDYDGDGAGDACDGDVDNDGVGNAADLCPRSAIGGTVHPDNGCSLHALCPCSGPFGSTESWRNHGQYVRCVTQTAQNFRDAGLIDEQTKGQIVNEADNSACGK